MRTWKISQPRASITEAVHPTKPPNESALFAAHSHSSRNRISPAYMLPNSRSECDSGLEMYSTQLKRKFAGHSRKWEPNGAQNSSWIQPPTPFAAIENQIIIPNTESESANVVLTSAVGTRRHSWMPIQPSAVDTRSAGMWRSEEHTSELQSRRDLVCRLLLEKKKKK